MEHTATIKIGGIQFEVKYDYQPEEPPTRCYSDNTGYPGCAESFNINSVSLGDIDFTQFFKDIDYMETIKELIKNRE